MIHAIIFHISFIIFPDQEMKPINFNIPPLNEIILMKSLELYAMRAIMWPYRRDNLEF